MNTGAPRGQAFTNGAAEMAHARDLQVAEGPRIALHAAMALT